MTKRLGRHPSVPLSRTDFRLFLLDELLRRCEANKQYSLRAFAKSLGVDAGSLSKMLSGHRTIGERVIRKMAIRLGLKPMETAAFCANVGNRRPAPYPDLDFDRFCVIADWQHFAILELMKVRSFKPSPRWIGQALGISTTEVNASLERLERIQMVARSGKTWKLLTPSSTTLSHLQIVDAHKRLQRQFLAKAADAVQDVPLEKRLQSGTTMAIDSKKLKEASQVVAEFRRKMATLLCSSPAKDQVYQLSVSLYPLSTL